MEGNHLTKEQNAMRLRGLRILARLIVRAHLSSLANGDGGLNGRVGDHDSDADPKARKGKNGA